MERLKHQRSNSVSLPKQDITVLKDASRAARLRRCMTATRKNKDQPPPLPPPRTSTLPRLRKPAQDNPSANEGFSTLPRRHKQAQDIPSANEGFPTLPSHCKAAQDNPSANEELSTLPRLRKPTQDIPSANEGFPMLPRRHKQAQDIPSANEEFSTLPRRRKAAQDMPLANEFLTLPRRCKPVQGMPLANEEFPRRHKPAEDLSSQDWFLTLPRHRKQAQDIPSPDWFLTLPRRRKPAHNIPPANEEFPTLPRHRKPVPSPEWFSTLPRRRKPTQDMPSPNESTSRKPVQDMPSPKSSTQASQISTIQYKYPKPLISTNEVSTTRQPEHVRAALRHSLSVERLKLSPKEPIPLSQFITKYSNFLPTQVQVRKGFCSSLTDLSISQDETFNFHFIKHTKVVSIRDSERKMEFSVPLNSSVEFSLVYDPNHNKEEAMNGFHFETAADVMAMSSLPTVIRATKDHSSGSSEDSVSANELLMVRGVRPSFVPGKGMELHVYSFTSGEKCLDEKCAGGFTTKPQLVALPLSSLIEHRLQFPQKAVICADKTINRTLPTAMSKSPIVLEGYKGETSIIATCTDGTTGPVFEISSDIGIHIEALDLPESNQKQLLENTLALYKTFDASNLQVLTEKPSSRAYELQLLLYSKVDRDKQPDGIQLVLPLLLPDNESAAAMLSARDHDQTLTIGVIRSGIPHSQDESIQVLTPLRPHFLLPPHLSPIPSIASTTKSMYQVVDSSQVHSEYVHMEARGKPSSVTVTVQADDGNTQERHLDVLKQSDSDFKGGVVQISKQLEKLRAKVDELGKMVVSTKSTDMARGPPLSDEVARMDISMDSSSVDTERGQKVVNSTATKPPEESEKVETLGEMKLHDDLSSQQHREYLAKLDYNKVSDISPLFTVIHSSACRILVAMVMESMIL